MAINDAIALDGFLDEETVPGDLDGLTARFRLTVSPSDELADEMVLPCTVADPAMAHRVIHDLLPGDKLRVTGHLHLPHTPGEPMWLVVTEMTLLQPAPGFTDVFTAVLERYGPYVSYLDADTETVPVWTETGAWVGVAESLDVLGQLLEAYEQRHRTGGEQP
ncbi:hypothetical protein [Streptomyces sp. cmx-10-25]|uniref:hypothetical protein n=1 Tax=Streptomyces sp. cmx-10-25 TaxID=2790919 RepID=UPI00398147BC